MSDREWARARVAARAFLRDNYPDAQWDEIDDLHRALHVEVLYGPMPYGYWSDKEGGDALCVQPWPGWADGCKMLSGLIEVLPVELYYDADSGYVTTSNPYDWEEVYTMPTIEALFDKELWRYLT